MKANLTWAAIMFNIQDLGFDRIKVAYSGGGDSGDIDEIYLLRPEDPEDHNEFNNIDGILSEDIRLAILEFAFSKLNVVEDWWNNDGGYGTMMIQVPSGQYEIDNNVYYTTTESYSHSGEFENFEI